MENISPVLNGFFRWIHVIAGIIWIGHLYFFNFVNIPFAAKMKEAGASKTVVPELMPRALFWFRWGAAWTWVTGVLLLMLIFYHGGLAFEEGHGWQAGAFVSIAISFLGFLVYDALYKSPLAQNPRNAAMRRFCAGGGRAVGVRLRRPLFLPIVLDSRRYAVRRLDKDATPAPLTAGQFDTGLKTAATFVHNTARLFADWSQSFLGRPNELPPADQAYCQRIGGDRNIFYYHGYFELAEDEALVVTLTPPECDFWNFQLANYWLESHDYRFRKIHVNKHTAVYRPDGSVEIVVAATDPGHPNWLDTCGHRRGTMCVRWIRAKTHPDQQARVVNVSEISSRG